MKLRHSLLSLLVVTATFSACAVVDDPNSLRGGGSDRSNRLLSTSVERDDDGVVDVVVYDDSDDPIVGEGEMHAAYGLVGAQAPPTVLFLNGRGATIYRGNNNSAANTSSIVRGTTSFPASKYRNDPTRWARIVDTVRQHFAAYNVTVVDEEPASGTYLEAVVTSGSPSLIGYGDSLGGIAPMRCGIVNAAVLFVFDSRLRNEIHVAEVASHEFGHSLSLSHTQLQTDLMSYTSRTPLSFSSGESRCGTSPSHVESCVCGGASQNNHAQLLRFVGPASTAGGGGGGGGADVPPPTPTAGGAAPILSPTNGSNYTAGQPVEIRADGAQVPAGATVALHWRVNDQTYAYSCPSSACSVTNGLYSWRIVPGGGERAFYTRVTAAGGQVYDSPMVRISSAAPPPAVTEPTDSSVSALCVAEINRYRATRGLAPLARWTGAEACTAQQAESDSQSRRAHGAFGACNEFAQNECPGWGGWRGDPSTVIPQCLSMMWDEGPGGGHYNTMVSTRYTQVACNYYVAPDGSVTAIQNFR